VRGREESGGAAGARGIGAAGEDWVSRALEGSERVRLEQLE